MERSFPLYSLRGRDGEKGPFPLALSHPEWLTTGLLPMGAALVPQLPHGLPAPPLPSATQGVSGWAEWMLPGESPPKPNHLPSTVMWFSPTPTPSPVRLHPGSSLLCPGVYTECMAQHNSDTSPHVGLSHSASEYSLNEMPIVENGITQPS